MKPRPDLNNLGKEVYEANKSKGFHDKEQSNEALLMLVVCELAEAVEADRKNKRALMTDFNEDVSVKEMYFKQAFETYIKDTIEDELADSVIRLLDLAGLRRIDLEERITAWGIPDNMQLEHRYANKPFADQVYHIIHYYLMGDRLNENVEYFILFSILNIEYLCRLLAIDLWLHVELKLKYNQLRPYKHEKEY